jgi:tetratricopeptide (TPR) repeat protein
MVHLLRTMPEDSNKVRTYYLLGYHYNFRQSRTDLARQCIDSGKVLAQKINYAKGVVNAHYHVGMVDMNEDNYQPALNHFYTYIKFYAARGDSLAVARGLYCIGTVHNKRGENNLNLAIQLRALKIYEQIGDQSNAANTLSAIAHSYWKSKKHAQAIATYNKSNAYYKAQNKLSNYAMGLLNLANVYVTKNSYDTAMQLYDQALILSKEHGNDVRVAYVLGNLGDLHEELGNYKQALTYNLQSLEIRRRLPLKNDLADILLDVGHMYWILRQYEQSEKYLNEGIALAQSIGAMDLLQTGYENLAELAIAKKNFQQAYEYSKISNQWKDSIYNETSMEQLNELHTKYETSEKDKQIALLAKEKEIQVIETERQSLVKKAFIAGFVLLTCLAGLIIHTIRQRLLLTTKNSEIKEVSLLHQLSELEVKALRAQINPHFLFNCLNSINRMIVKGENENASLYLKKFSKLVRLILENVETNKVSLHNELALIESYIQLEELRFKGKIGYEISIDEKIERENTYLPPMVLQPFVENAIWHGLMHKEANEPGLIKIAVKEDNDVLLCTIEDNGVGRGRSGELKEKDDTKTKSIGIKITEERLRLLSKKRINDLIRIIDLKDTLDTARGTRVEISIPLS